MTEGAARCRVTARGNGGTGEGGGEEKEGGWWWFGRHSVCVFGGGRSEGSVEDLPVLAFPAT